MSKSNKRIGLSLSGGGARGIAHIGVIKALLEHNLIPEVVSGTSAGAIVGTLYAAGKQPDEMEDFVRSASFIRAILPSWPNKGLVSLAYLKKHLIKHLNIDTFEGLSRPMYIAMSKLNSGKIVIKHEGPLYDPIMASCAIPLVFKPVTIENETYVDGGLLMNLPASVIRDQCDILIGVNLNPYLPIPETRLNSARNIVERCFDLTINNNTKAEADLCDLLIEPAEILDYHIFQFQKTTDLIELGYQAGLKALEGFQLK